MRNTVMNGKPMRTNMDVMGHKDVTIHTFGGDVTTRWFLCKGYSCWYISHPNENWTGPGCSQAANFVMHNGQRAYIQRLWKKLGS